MYGIMTLIFMWLVSFTVNVCAFHDCVCALVTSLISTIVSAIVIYIFAEIVDEES